MMHDAKTFIKEYLQAFNLITYHKTGEKNSDFFLNHHGQLKICHKKAVLLNKESGRNIHPDFKLCVASECRKSS